MEKTTFPSVLGRVCFHPCEQECRRNEINEPIAICALKRFVTEADQSSWEDKIPIQASTGEKIAIIGAGPTGLTAGYFLRRKGHEVVIYESEPNIGGLLHSVLPLYRLPKNVLQRDLEFITATGIEINTDVHVGLDISFTEILSDFSSIFIASGAQVGKRLDLPGSDLKNVYWGIEFLKKIKSGDIETLGKDIIVIGGGGVAIDVALTVKRLGTKNVHLACLESKSEIPAHNWEVKEAIKEGISINYSWGPKKILEDNSNVIGIELIECTSVFDIQGNFSPQFNEQNKIILKGDTIILAIGQVTDLVDMGLPSSIEITPWNTIQVEDKSLQTTNEKVFSGGEVVSGPLSIVEAIEAGKKAAIAIDKYLGGDGDIYLPLIKSVEKNPYIGRIEGFGQLSRIKMPKIDIDGRIKSFDEIEIGYDNEMAIKEAGRCLQCDLRLEISPIHLPPQKWIVFEENQVMNVLEKSGVVQLLDENKEIYLIQGTISLRSTLLELLESYNEAKYFIFEEDEMYTKRESELLQQYLQTHGSLPHGNESELDDDLF